MTKDLWMNLPVKDINRSREFFNAIGFGFKDGPGNSDTMAPLVVGTKETIVMLIVENVFKGATQNPISDTAKGTEVIFSFSAESREEVEEVARKVTAAGGNVFAPPAEIQGWMYGCAFTDPDGHRWNALFMDMSKR
ncbi:extradiol dioxygenase [Mucilaginibacter sp. 14171R-50]|uniref:VOC family protein n=1 Tax=Mucilaginibacter sp. 14171R-50 TaxID=2703789 RepID=UPI00138C5FFD|nr:VOC family protein [Mucilaginibacter sp. 14171R-50]QHS54796.1 extradiol dioxygenase [Mucilaginibacter sp. 14171R-50]